MLLQIKVKKHHVRAMWWSVEQIFNDDVEGCPYTQDQLADTRKFLYERIRKSTKEYNLKMGQERMILIWGCVKTVLDNTMIENAEQVPTFIEVFQELGKTLEARSILDHVAPVEIVR